MALQVGVLHDIVIFDQALYHRPDGLVLRWCEKVTFKFEAEAIRYAPIRSGELKAGISGEVHQVGPRQVAGTIGSSANHTMFVLRGTGDFGPYGGKIRTTLGFANPGGATRMVEGYINPRTKKFTEQFIPGARPARRLRRQKGYWLKVRAGRGFPKRIAFEVSGQHPNNFLLKAWRATARNHSSIRGPVPTFILDP